MCLLMHLWSSKYHVSNLFCELRSLCYSFLSFPSLVFSPVPLSFLMSFQGDPDLASLKKANVGQLIARAAASKDPRVGFSI